MIKNMEDFKKVFTLYIGKLVEKQGRKTMGLKNYSTTARLHRKIVYKACRFSIDAGSLFFCKKTK